MANLINKDVFIRQFKENIEEELAAEAEPIIVDALERFEAEIRSRLGIIVLSISSHYSVMRDGSDICIHVKNDTSGIYK